MTTGPWRNSASAEPFAAEPLVATRGPCYDGRLGRLGAFHNPTGRGANAAMNLHHDDAYVLRTQPLGDADLIVTLFAAEGGKVRGVARSARRSRKRFGGALEPMTRVRLGWVEKTGRELHRIESMEIDRSFASMQADPTLQAACAVVAEMCEVFAHEGEPDRKTFDLVGAVLAALESDLDAWIGVRYFEYWLLRLHGLLPDTDRCAACDGPAGGTVLRVEPGLGARCHSCADDSIQTVRLGLSDCSFLDAARGNPPEAMGAHGDASRSGGALEAFFRASLEGFTERPIRAYRHLRAMTREMT